MRNYRAYMDTPVVWSGLQKNGVRICLLLVWVHVCLSSACAMLCPVAATCVQWLLCVATLCRVYWHYPEHALQRNVCVVLLL